MRVLFVNQFYLPDAAATGQLLGDLTEGFVGARVVCGAGGYASNLGGARPGSVEVVRLGGVGFGHGVIRKLGSYLAFYLRALGVVLLGPRADVVVTMTTPPGLGVLGWAAQGWRGSRHVIWEMDVYPDVAEELGTFRKGGWVARLLGGVMDAARRRADAVVVLGRCMAERMAGRGVAWSRIHVCENWADGRLVEVAPFHDEQELRVLYSGNLGLAHDVETLAGALARLGDGFRVLVSGGGPRRGWLERACAGREWVSFRGYEERERLGALLAWGDVGLVTQRAETVGTVVPSKAYGVMAAGRGVVYVGPAESEVGRMVEEMGVGWRVSNGDAAGLAALLERLRGDRAEVKRVGAQARRVFEERYERGVGVSRVKGVIEQCIRLYS
jgi:colanic acid biosynthesis glycosyl transferase WcaI